LQVVAASCSANADAGDVRAITEIASATLRLPSSKEINEYSDIPMRKNREFTASSIT
jgi:hypothetical protein